MNSEPTHRFPRVLALAAVVGNVAFNYLSERGYAEGDDMRVVTERYDNLFQPAPYAFAIWGVIYAAFFAYAVYALLPSQKYETLHDSLSWPLVVANLLGSAWIVAFRHDMIGLSVAIMAVTLGTAIVLYTRSRGGSALVTTPFSLYLGWISVATLANVAIFFESIGVTQALLGERAWTVILVATAVGIAFILAARYVDAVVPAVVAWASIAIFVEAYDRSHVVGIASLVLGLLSAAVAIAVAGATYRTIARNRGPHLPRTT